MSKQPDNFCVFRRVMKSAVIHEVSSESESKMGSEFGNIQKFLEREPRVLRVTFHRINTESVDPVIYTIRVEQ
jgi:hypothetical protein